MPMAGTGECCVPGSSGKESKQCNAHAACNIPQLSSETRKQLRATATALASPEKGILAADESTGTIGKRLEKINMANTCENARTYRELLFTTNKELANYVSGVILYEETLRQKSSNGVAFPELIKQMGIIVGIKVDKGITKINGCETVTNGLDGLAERLDEYVSLGAKFAKWRSVLRIGPCQPSSIAIEQNARDLARYATICQSKGIVPIIEPEILTEGNHDIVTSLFVSEAVMSAVYKACHDYGVYLEGTLLKPSMVLPGQDSQQVVSPEEIAEATVVMLQRTVPVSVPGIVFLSGGQSEKDSTINLNAINKVAGKKPWNLAFSYGRALQGSVLSTWNGKPENVAAAQKQLLNLAKNNSQASAGKYKYESATAGQCSSNFVKDYLY